MSRRVIYSLHAHAVRGEVGHVEWHLTRSIHEVGTSGHSRTVARGEVRLEGHEDTRQALKKVLLDAAGVLVED